MTHQIQNIAPFALIHSITSSGDIGSGMLPGRVNGAHPATSLRYLQVAKHSSCGSVKRRGQHVRYSSCLEPITLVFNKCHLGAPTSSWGLESPLQIANVGHDLLRRVQEESTKTDDDAPHVTVIPVRDVPDSEARQEINRYIDQLLRNGEHDFSAGEIACKLMLDLNIVIDVLEERGFL